MHYDLLIVGNGYDLGCEYKTSYEAFLRYVGGKGVTNQLISFFLSAYNRGIVTNYEWNGFENLLCQYLQFLDYLFNNTTNVKREFVEQYYDLNGNPVNRYYKITILDISKAPLNVFTILMLTNPLERRLAISSDSEFRFPFNSIDDYNNLKELYFKVFINSSFTQSTDKYVLKFLLEELEKRLQNLEEELKSYIKMATNGPANPSATLFDIKADRIISFNYSKTAQSICELDDKNVAYVHGNVDSNIIVGVEKTMIDGQTFSEESSYIMFFKRFRRIFKNCNNNYNNKIINQLNNNSTIAIYGHSLDLADSSLLKPIFEKRYKRYDIYCYKDENVYKIKLASLLNLDLYDELEKDGKIHLIVVN